MNKKRLVVLVLLFSMIFTSTACTSDAFEKESENDSLPVQESQILNVASYSNFAFNENIKADIKNAMLEIYPGYELNLTKFKNEESYNSSIQVSLMSGQPYDLVHYSKYLQLDKFIESEYFKDINELIENDKSVSTDDYYINALKAYEINEKLYCMPTGFSYDCFVGINTKLSPETINNYKKLDSISINTILDIFKTNKENDNLVLISNINHLRLIEPSIASYIDYENKTYDFNSDRFIKFLTDIKESMFSSEGYEAYYDNMIEQGFYTLSDDIISSAKAMFTIRHFHGMEQALIDYVDPYFDHFIPLTNENDESIISSMAVYCIGNTANAEMAWDFFKFYIDIFNNNISLFENMSLSTIPIKKDLFDYKAKMYMTGAVVANTGVSIEIGNDIRISGNGKNNYGGDLMYDTDTTINRGIEKLEKFNKLPMIGIQQLDTDGSLYTETIDNFMKGLITVDQAAQQIQNTMSLYLSE